MKKAQECTKCEGYGSILYDTGVETCDWCHGTGLIRYDRRQKSNEKTRQEDS